MDLSRVLVVVGSGAVSAAASLIATSMARSSAHAHFTKISPDKPRVGFTADDIANSIDLSITRFQLWVLALSAPSIVLIATASSETIVRITVANIVLVLGSFLILHRLSKLDSPRNFGKWNRITLRKPKESTQTLLVETTPGSPRLRDQITHVSKTDLWAGVVIAVEIYLVT